MTSFSHRAPLPLCALPRLTPTRLSTRENASTKRYRKRLNSTALCQGWMAKAAARISPNSVWKKPDDRGSVMALACVQRGKGMADIWSCLMKCLRAIANNWFSLG